MNRSVRLLACCLFVGPILAGCHRATEPARAQFLVFGTEVEVLIRSDDSLRTDVAFRQLGELFQQLHRDWHPWQAGALFDLNQDLANGRLSQPDQALLDLIESAQRFELASSGRFNAAIGGLVRLWGFHTSNYPIQAPPPDPQQIERWLTQAPSTLDIDRNADGVRSRNPAVQLDFSGLAKGHASRLACDLLNRSGLSDALINLGGDIMICGPAARSWTIAISDGQRGLYGYIEVDDGPLAIFSSGSAQRWGEWDGTRYAHLLDPLTGQALTHAIQATVIHADPAVADAAATALAIAGDAHWTLIAQQMAIEDVLLLDADGVLEITDQFQARLVKD